MTGVRTERTVGSATDGVRRDGCAAAGVVGCARLRALTWLSARAERRPARGRVAASSSATGRPPISPRRFARCRPPSSAGPWRRAAGVRPRGPAAVRSAAIAARPGIEYVQSLASRKSQVEPALAGGQLRDAYEWQFSAAREDSVPDWVRRAASGITIAIIDTGADLAAPDLAAKAPAVYDVRTRGPTCAT